MKSMVCIGRRNLQRRRQNNELRSVVVLDAAIKYGGIWLLCEWCLLLIAFVLSSEFIELPKPFLMLVLRAFDRPPVDGPIFMELIDDT
jgi:hypothetical protein